MNTTLTENVDFYFNEHGLMVLTEKYHLDRGHCCGNGCYHCPYQFDAVPEPLKTHILSNIEQNNSTDID